MLLGNVAETPARVADEEERDDLEDALAVPVEPVADVAELAERVPVCAGLLRDLSEGGLLGPLAGVDPALRQGPDPSRLPARPDRRHHPLAPEPPHQHRPGRELPLHQPKSKLPCGAGTLIARVPAEGTSLLQGGGQRMNLKPLGDRLIVEVLEEEEMTVSWIVLPDTAKEKPQRGRVLAVGPGSRDDKGEYVTMDLEEGDEVIFSKYGGTEIKLGTDDVLILRESDVLAKVVGDRAAVA